MTLSRSPEYVIRQYKACADEFDAKARSAIDVDSAADYEAAAEIARRKADELEKAA